MFQHVQPVITPAKIAQDHQQLNALHVTPTTTENTMLILGPVIVSLIIRQTLVTLCVILAVPTAKPATIQQSLTVLHVIH